MPRPSPGNKTDWAAAFAVETAVEWFPPDIKMDFAADLAWMLAWEMSVASASGFRVLVLCLEEVEEKLVWRPNKGTRWTGFEKRSMVLLATLLI